MHYEGPRRQGRFIKNGSKVMSRISLMDFRFTDIGESDSVDLDNARRNVIHVQYHEPSELKAGVKTPEKFNDDLVGLEQKRPVIMPLDFTQEWERNKKLRKDRIARQDDEDFEFELAEQQQRLELEEEQAEMAAKKTSETVQLASPAAAEAQQAPPASAEKSAAPLSQDAHLPKESTVQPRPSGMVTGTEKQWEYMDQVGQAINRLQNTAQEAPSQPPRRIGMDPSPLAQGSSPQGAEFIPSPTRPEAVLEPEAEAARAYQRLKEMEEQNKAQLQHIAEEAKAQGYLAGFQAGEEKAELQVRQNAAHVFGKVSDLIQEFTRLKHDVLANVQENFYELCQAMAEALIKREFSLRPETFVTVLKRAIEEAVEPGKVKVRVHPKAYDRLIGLVDGEMKAALAKDPEVAEGDFKLESSLSVVDGNVGKMIADLLKQADLSLFETAEAPKEKAS